MCALSIDITLTKCSNSKASLSMVVLSHVTVKFNNSTAFSLVSLYLNLFKKVRLLLVCSPKQSEKFFCGESLKRSAKEKPKVCGSNCRGGEFGK